MRTRLALLVLCGVIGCTRPNGHAVLGGPEPGDEPSDLAGVDLTGADLAGVDLAPAQAVDGGVVVADAGLELALDKLPPFDDPAFFYEHSIGGARVHTDVAKRPRVTDSYRHTSTYVGTLTTATNDYDMQAGVLSLGRSVANLVTTTYNPPVEVLHAPLHVGDSWSQTVNVVTGLQAAAQTRTTTVVGVEDITVPAGTFRCAKLHVSATGARAFEADQWWNSAAGLVSSSVNDTQLLDYKR